MRLKKAAGGKLVKAVNMAYNAEDKRDGDGAVIKAE